MWWIVVRRTTSSNSNAASPPSTTPGGRVVRERVRRGGGRERGVVIRRGLLSGCVFGGLYFREGRDGDLKFVMCFVDMDSINSISNSVKLSNPLFLLQRSRGSSG